MKILKRFENEAISIRYKNNFHGVPIRRSKGGHDALVVNVTQDDVTGNEAETTFHHISLLRVLFVFSSS